MASDHLAQDCALASLESQRQLQSCHFLIRLKINKNKTFGMTSAIRGGACLSLQQAVLLPLLFCLPLPLSLGNSG